MGLRRAAPRSPHQHLRKRTGSRSAVCRSTQPPRRRNAVPRRPHRSKEPRYPAASQVRDKFWHPGEHPAPVTTNPKRAPGADIAGAGARLASDPCVTRTQAATPDAEHLGGCTRWKETADPGKRPERGTGCRLHRRHGSHRRPRCSDTVRQDVPIRPLVPTYPPLRQTAFGGGRWSGSSSMLVADRARGHHCAESRQVPASTRMSHCPAASGGRRGGGGSLLLCAGGGRRYGCPGRIVNAARMKHISKPLAGPLPAMRVLASMSPPRQAGVGMGRGTELWRIIHDRWHTGNHRRGR